MSLAFPEAYDFVERHRDHLGVADPDGYVAQFRAFMDDGSENARAATIAADAAKSLINIAVVFFVALGAFALAYLSTHATFGLSIPVVLLAASAVATIASMVAGFAAIASQRAFRVQPLLGLVALVLFAIGLFFWDPVASPAAPDPRVDQLQNRIDALQARLDQQVADVAKAIQAAGASRPASPAAPPLNFVGLTQVPPKLDAIVEALRELKAAIPPPAPPPPAPVAVTQPPPAPAAAAAPARQEGDLSRADWTKIQEALTARGFPTGKADGLPRRKTRDAIRAYQEKQHASDDGRLTPQQIDDLLGAH